MNAQIDDLRVTGQRKYTATSRVGNVEAMLSLETLWDDGAYIISSFLYQVPPSRPYGRVTDEERQRMRPVRLALRETFERELRKAGWRSEKRAWPYRSEDTATAWLPPR